MGHVLAFLQNSENEKREKEKMQLSDTLFLSASLLGAPENSVGLAREDLISRE
jgi:hypothetical protein